MGASYRRYLHADHQGSIIAQSSSTGGVLFRNAYDPYGIPRDTNEGRFGYTGQAWLKELGLYHYKARMYHPKIGRFLQTDPIFYADDMNMYLYVRGDPMNAVDPMGLEYTCAENDGVKTCEGTQDDVEAMKNEMEGYQITMATSGFGLKDIPEPVDVGDVYASGAFGADIFHHVYAVSHKVAEDRAAWGRYASVGTDSEGKGLGYPPEIMETGRIPEKNLKVGDIYLPAGKTFEDFRNEAVRTGNSGLWVPWINDCHTSLTRASRNLGGAFFPNSNYGGRVNWR